MGSINSQLQHAFILHALWSPTISLNDPIRRHDSCEFHALFNVTHIYFDSIFPTFLYLPLPGVIIIWVKRGKSFYIENLTVYVGISQYYSDCRCWALALPYWLSTLWKCTLGGLASTKWNIKTSDHRQSHLCILIHPWSLPRRLLDFFVEEAHTIVVKINVSAFFLRRKWRIMYCKIRVALLHRTHNRCRQLSVFHYLNIRCCCCLKDREEHP